MPPRCPAANPETTNAPTEVEALSGFRLSPEPVTNSTPDRRVVKTLSTEVLALCSHSEPDEPPSSARNTSSLLARAPATVYSVPGSDPKATTSSGPESSI